MKHIIEVPGESLTSHQISKRPWQLEQVLPSLSRGLQTGLSYKTGITQCLGRLPRTGYCKTKTPRSAVENQPQKHIPLPQSDSSSHEKHPFHLTTKCQSNSQVDGPNFRATTDLHAASALRKLLIRLSLNHNNTDCCMANQPRLAGNLPVMTLSNVFMHFLTHTLEPSAM